MLTSPTPFTLFVNQLRILRSQLPGVRDGDPESVHDARVATRRIRELLELVDGNHAEDVRADVRRMGRDLGRVRDVDVRIALLARLESRIPPAAPALVALRHTLEQKRAKQLRAAIKRFEKPDLDSLFDHQTLNAIRRTLSHRTSWARWTVSLRRIISARGKATTEAINHTSGVYFPNRIHRARIAIKKMRYAMEIATESGLSNLLAQIQELKGMQDALGELHDRQSLLDELPTVEPGDSSKALAPLVLVREVLHANIQRLHSRFVSRRNRLLDISRAAESPRTGRPWVVAIPVAAGVLALASGAILVPRRRSLGAGTAIGNAT
jgi:CHAD domain-containing protein